MATVSVVITTIGRLELTRAVESVLAQTYGKIEIIVVGPSGNNVLPKGVRHLNFDKPINVCTARNIGTQASSGDFIAYLDDDDYWYPQKISRQVEALSQLPPRTILGCRYEILSSSGKSFYPREILIKNQSMISYLFGKINLKPGLRYFQTSGIILAKADAQEIGWDEEIPRHNDWDFLLRAEGFEFSFVQLEDVLVVVDQRQEGSISRNNSPYLSSAFYNRYKERMDSREESSFLLSAVFQSVVNSKKVLPIGSYAVRIIRLNNAPKTYMLVILRLLNIRKLFLLLQSFYGLFSR
jgi:glycosyltransferase involved in cell wall biosynthesis